jgi:hypothetical protein
MHGMPVIGLSDTLRSGPSGGPGTFDIKARVVPAALSTRSPNGMSSVLAASYEVDLGS